MSRKPIHVTLFSGSRCPYCSQARRLLQQHNVSFTERNIQTNTKAFKDFSRLGGREIPLIRIGNTTLFGFNHKQLINTLKAEKAID